jgi:hypothetical protein
MHYTPDGRGDFNTVVHQNIRLLEVTVTDIMDSQHLSVMFSILDPVRMRKALHPVEKLTDRELFQASALKSYLLRISKFTLLRKVIQ